MYLLFNTLDEVVNLGRTLLFKRISEVIVSECSPLILLTLSKLWTLLLLRLCLYLMRNHHEVVTTGQKKLEQAQNLEELEV